MSGHLKDQLWPRVRDLTHKIAGLRGPLGSPLLHLLTGQLQQASYSMGADGDGDGTAWHADLIRYLEIARGCVGELDYQLQRARQGALPDRRPYRLLHQEVAEVRRTLAGILREARRTGRKG